jgi:FkbM family methyltransferase
MNWFKASEPSLLGSEYGGWTLPSRIFDRLKGITLFSCGVGEDISFDHEILKRSDWRIMLVDPTPRAKVHFSYYMEMMKRKIPYSINNSSSLFYSAIDVGPDFEKRLTYTSAAVVGTSVNEESIPMHVPRVASHVSHSAQNRLDTEIGFFARTKNIHDLLQAANNPGVWAVKMDIEGSEWDVIDDILGLPRSRYPVFICIEVHKLASHLDYAGAVSSLVKKCEMHGFLQYFKKGDDITLIKADIT